MQTKLPNNCHIGTMSVSPKNWRDKGASIAKPWFISYRWHDPAKKEKHPYGKMIVVKRMNHITTLQGRQKEVKDIIEMEMQMLKNGWNPFTGRYTKSEQVQELEPYTPFLTALEYARENIKVVPATKINMKSQLGFLKVAAIQLDYYSLGICEIKRRHVKTLLNKVVENRPTDNNSRYNKFRRNLKILFSYILDTDMDVIEENPVNDIKLKEEVTKVKEVLTPDERSVVDMHLRKKKLMRFRLYMRIFFHSGIRNTELLKVKGCHVDLKGQWFTVTILKGKSPSTVRKTIKTIAVRYWKLALKDCAPGDYIFSKNLYPGENKIHESQINRRWNRHVKKELGIEVDFYAFKHANSTEVVDQYGFATSAAINSHKDETMVRKLYDVKRDEREHEKIKDVKNWF